MKKSLSFLLFWLLAFFTYRVNSKNLIQNPGFESVNALPFTPTNCEKSFEGQSSNWSATHGTPHLSTPSGSDYCGSSSEPRNGNYSAVMVCAGYGLGTPYSEGIFQSITFTSGKVYKVTFKAASSNGGGSTSYFIKATTGLSAYVGFDGQSIPSPTTSTTIYNGTSLNTSLTQYTTYFFPTSNYNQIWFYPELSSANNSVHLVIDDVEVTEISGIIQTSGTNGLVCSSGSSFQSLYSSSSYTWSSPTGNLSISGSGNSVTVTPTGSGNTTLCVQVDNGQTYCTQFWTGSPAINTITVYNNYNQPTNSTDMCNGSGLNVQVNTTQATSASWSVSCCNAYLTDYGNGMAYFNSYNNDCYGLNVTATNACGNTQDGVTICVEDCFYSYRVYPNPAKNYFYLEFDQTDNLSSLPERVELLSEKSTNPVRSINIQEVHERKGFVNGNRLEFDVKDLPRGVYYVHVTNSRRKEKEKDSIRLIIE